MTGDPSSLNAAFEGGKLDQNPLALRARAVQRWLSGDITGAFEVFWAAHDADPTNERIFLTMMSFYSQTGVGTHVTKRPLVLAGAAYWGFESLSPLVVSQFTQGPEKGNYLQYYMMEIEQGWSRIRMNIQGQLLGGDKAPCEVYPRIVFWKDDHVIGETLTPYPVHGQFAIDYWIEPPSQATHFTPRISLGVSCLDAGQKVRVDSVTLYPER